MYRKLLLVCSAIATAVLLSGCLVPERFVARVDIQPDAGYSYRFDGTAMDAMALLKLQQQGMHVFTNARVERAKGFIQQQDICILTNRSGQHQTLPLSVTHFSEILILHILCMY